MKRVRKKSISEGTDLFPCMHTTATLCLRIPQTSICCFQFKCRGLSVFVVLSSGAIRNMASANVSAVLQTYQPCSNKTCLKEQTLEGQS